MIRTSQAFMLLQEINITIERHNFTGNHYTCATFILDGVNYIVNDDGVYIIIDGKTLKKKKCNLTQTGYLRYVFHLNSGTKTIYEHVLKAFCLLPDMEVDKLINGNETYEVNHMLTYKKFDSNIGKYRIMKNHSIDCLEIITKRENILHAAFIKKHTEYYGVKVSASDASKLKIVLDSYDKSIRDLYKSGGIDLVIRSINDEE